ncbi:MAG: type II toxin-antitoxin system HicB family antitoxin [Acidobacteriaceae bacterium]
MRYPVKLKADGPYFVVTFPDVPPAITQGDSKEDALLHALDALETVLMYAFGTGEAIPLPSPLKRGQAWVELPPTVAAKVFLHNEMLRQKVRPIDLARRMGIPRQELTRMLDLRHNTKIDTTAQALAALGKRLELRVA